MIVTKLVLILPRAFKWSGRGDLASVVHMEDVLQTVDEWGIARVFGG